MAIAGALTTIASLQTDDFTRGARRIKNDLQDVQSAAGQSVVSLKNLGLAAAGAVAGFASLSAIKTALVDVIQTGVKLDTLRAAFTAVEGSAKAGGGALSFVRDTANRLGADFQPLAEAFKGVSASARGTSLEGAQTREIFTSIVTASRALQLSGEDTKGVLLAIQQIMSKGKVQAEELRGQIGERLPGAFNIAARAMGVTTEKLSDMLEKGQLLSTDFLPKFARQLQTEFAGAAKAAGETAQSAFARFGNELVDLKNRLAQDILPALAKAAGFVADILKSSRETRAAVDDAARRGAQRAAGGDLFETFIQTDQDRLIAIEKERQLLLQQQQRIPANAPLAAKLTAQLKALEDERQLIQEAAKNNAAALARTQNSFAGEDTVTAQQEAFLRNQAQVTALDAKAKAAVQAYKDDLVQLNKEAALTPELIDQDAKKLEIAKARAAELRDILLQRQKLGGGVPQSLAQDLQKMEGQFTTTTAAIEAKDAAEKESQRLAREGEQAEAAGARAFVEDYKARQAAEDALIASLKEERDVLVFSRETLERRKAAETAFSRGPELEQQLKDTQELRSTLEELAMLEDRVHRSRVAGDEFTARLAKVDKQNLKEQTRDDFRNIKALQEAYQSFAETLASSIVDASNIAKNGIKSFVDSAIQDLVRLTARLYLTPLINQLIQKGVTALGSFLAPALSGTPALAAVPSGGFESPIPALAEGGPTYAGQSYLVGEQGPELFTPRTNGAIIPNGQYLGAPVIVQIYAQDTGSFRRSQGEISQRIAAAVAAGQRAT